LALSDRGYRGAFLAFAGTIPAEDLEEIRRAVEEDCERIDEEGW
jgi:hypothetical protein